MEQLLARTKNILLFGYISVMVLLLALTTSTLVQVSTTHKQVDDIKTHQIVKLTTINNLHNSARERLMYYFLLVTEYDHLDSTHHSVKITIDEFQTHLDEIDARYYSTRKHFMQTFKFTFELQSILHDESNIYEDVLKLERQALGIMQGSKSYEDAIHFFEDRVIPRQQQVIERLSRAVNIINAEVVTSTALVEESVHMIKSIVVIISLIVMSLIVVIGWLTTKRITSTEDELFHEKERAETTLLSISEAVITTNLDGMVRYVNSAASNLIGWSKEKCCGLHITEVLDTIDEHSQEHVDPPLDVILRGKVIQVNDIILQTKHGEKVMIEMSGSPIRGRDDQIVGTVLVLRDITESQELARQLSYQAKHDPLTGLANRTEFENQLKQLLRDARNNKRAHAVLFMDLDQFKVVNDTCGHIAGDKLLKDLTFQLQTRVRDTDVLARLGGDEFGVLLRTCSTDKAYEVANQLRQVIQDFRFVWEGNSFVVTVSIGIVPITANSDSVVSVLSAADTAMYAAKDKGRNRIYVYEGNDKETMKRHGEMQWVTRITQALEEDRFVLYFQPIVPTQDVSKPNHYEILIRMFDENNDLVPPMAFIPAAERYNMMPTIDRWVIKTLFQFIADHSDKLNPEKHIFAVNLSGSSINDETFLSYVREQFYYSNISPTQICFEVTETVAIANLTSAATFIKELKTMGSKFALDDFGSGLSSFGYLKSLPVDLLKIDGAFVKDITTDPIDQAMVTSINQVGHTIGIETIAEFVENEDVLNMLKQIGVDFAQGYHIAKPTPLSLAGILTKGH